MTDLFKVIFAGLLFLGGAIVIGIFGYHWVSGILYGWDHYFGLNHFFGLIVLVILFFFAGVFGSWVLALSGFLSTCLLWNWPWYGSAAMYFPVLAIWTLFALGFFSTAAVLGLVKGLSSLFRNNRRY